MDLRAIKREMDKEAAVRPRTVDTAQYVKDRIEQIAELLEVVDNSALKPGEVTSGPRTVFQRLPRHMRRRAMSHNVKRLPRASREMALRYAAKCAHRKKPPSRKWRRRPTRLLKKLQRLRRRNVWLETHIWHAKRFHMIDLWGWKLPLRSFQRGFRPTYRNAIQSAVVLDLSYLCCTQISSKNVNTSAGQSTMERDAIARILSRMCVGSVSASFAFAPALRDGVEWTALLYKPNAYPYDFIGPVRFSWAIDRKSNDWSLHIWSHPSTHSVVLRTILQLISAKLISPNSEEKMEVDDDKLEKSVEIAEKNNAENKLATEKKKEKKKSESDSKIKQPNRRAQRRAANAERLKEYKEECEKIQKLPNLYESDEFKVVDLRHELIRIRLIGPNLFPLLSKALYLVSDPDLKVAGLFDEFKESHEFWHKRICNTNFPLQAGCLRNGSVISLMVEDPRLFRAGHSKMCTIANDSAGEIGDVPPLPHTSTFWRQNFRRKQLNRRLTNAQMEKARREHALSGLRSTPFKIPILLIVQSVNSSNQVTSSAAQNRIDLLAPAETGMDFWLALQFSNGRAAGLADKIGLDFQSGTLSFPADCADSPAGAEYAQIDATTSKARHLRKPHNRRLKYEGRLRVKYPFTFEWKELIDDWRNALSPPANNVTEHLNGSSKTAFDGNQSGRYYVLRDRIVLSKINDWFVEKKGCKKNETAPSTNQTIDAIFRKHANALITLRFIQSARGRIKRMALVCLPSKEDLKLSRNAIIEEPNPRAKKNLSGDEEEKMTFDIPLVKKVEQSPFGDFMPIEESTFATGLAFDGTLVKLSELFPDENAARLKRKREKKAKRKMVVKKRKLDEKNETEPTTLADVADIVSDEIDSTANTSLILMPSYRESCSRQVVGRVIRGDYSFLKSCGVSFGYCPLSALRLMRPSKKVLLRNISSKFYHPANVSIVLSPSGAL